MYSFWACVSLCVACVVRCPYRARRSIWCHLQQFGEENTQGRPAIDCSIVDLRPFLRWSLTSHLPYHFLQMHIYSPKRPKNQNKDNLTNIARVQNCPVVTILINLFGQDQSQGALGGHGGQGGWGGWGGRGGWCGQGVRVVRWLGSSRLSVWSG